MVRPRLVEEGVPIGQTSDDHEMEHSPSSNMADGDNRMMMATHSHQPAHSHYGQHQHQHAETSSRPSSLMLAAGGRLPTVRQQKTYKAHATQADNALHDDLFGHAQARDLRPPPPAHYGPISNGHSFFSAPTRQQAPPVAAARPARPPPAQQHYTNTSQIHHHCPQFHSHTQHHEIGVDTRVTERMQGVQDLSIKTPLIVLDGANVAYAYAQTVHATDYQRGRKMEPNVTGIRVAVDYFLQADLRVLVVLPASWFRSKPRPGDSNNNSSNANMMAERLEILHDLQQTGRIVSSPPTDDDDAYALTIAQREVARAAARNGQGPGYVLSNDMFRDAAARDETGQVHDWLTHGVSSETGPGRISFAFCDMGSRDDYGDLELDIVPNPRHPLVAWIERNQRHDV